MTQERLEIFNYIRLFQDGIGIAYLRIDQPEKQSKRNDNDDEVVENHLPHHGQIIEKNLQ